MKCAGCFQFLYWNIICCIRQYWNCILYFRIRSFPALSIDSTNWTQQFFVSFFIHSSPINSHLINTISLLWRSALHPIVTRIVNSACVNCLIDFKTSIKVSVTIDGDYNSIGTPEVLVASWNVLCAFNFCIEILFIVFDNIEIAFCILVFDHSRHSVSTRLIGHNNLSHTPGFNRQVSKTNSKSHFLLLIPFSSRVGI